MYTLRKDSCWCSDPISMYSVPRKYVSGNFIDSIFTDLQFNMELEVLVNEFLSLCFQKSTMWDGGDRNVWNRIYIGTILTTLHIASNNIPSVNVLVV